MYWNVHKFHCPTIHLNPLRISGENWEITSGILLQSTFVKDIYKRTLFFLCVGMLEVKSRNPLGTYVFYGFDRYVLKTLETY